MNGLGLQKNFPAFLRFWVMPAAGLQNEQPIHFGEVGISQHKKDTKEDVKVQSSRDLNLITGRERPYWKGP